MQRASVDVQVIEFRSRPISVIGAVKQPGNLGFSGRWTLLEALTAAGGLTDNHGNVVYVLRRADNGLSDQVAIRLDDLLVRGDPKANIPIFANDLINVPETVEITVYCLGEVGRPGALVFKSNERITLLAAIAHAGGLTDRASSKILIKRAAGLDGPAGVDRRLQEDPRRQGARRRAETRRRHRRQGVLLLSPLTPVPMAEEPVLAPEPESEFNIAEYFGMVRRHWKLAVVCCVARPRRRRHPLRHHARRQYQATATIQIERRNLSPVGNGQNPWLENYWNMEFYPTQYELLQSRGLAERVVKSLDLMEDPRVQPRAPARGRAGAGPHRRGRRGRPRAASPTRSAAASRSRRCAPPSSCGSPSAPRRPSSPPRPPTPSPSRSSTWASRTATPPPARPPPS